MPNLEFERLQEIGSFGLTCTISYSILECGFGDGYQESALVGDANGLRGWKLIFKVLPGTPDGPVQTTDSLSESRADYIWNFFCRRMAEGNSSFIIKDPRSGKDFLAGFTDKELSYEMFATLLFSSGVMLQQRRETGVPTVEDGSLGLSENVDVI